MPFRSTAQARAAWGGYLGPEMKDKAESWAHETPDLKALPAHVKSPKPLQRHAILRRLDAMKGK